MNEKLDEAIKHLASRLLGRVPADEAMKLSQAVLNLATAKERINQ